jgi:hypothetical protein
LNAAVLFDASGSKDTLAEAEHKIAATDVVRNLDEVFDVGHGEVMKSETR